jgi:catechol 2,3-dioxygenase-like lactoylglutathione lyase family enzyme
MVYPKAFSHIGISVPDIEKAVKWYSEVLGLNILMGPTKNDGDETHIGKLNKGVFGDKFYKSKVAHLSTSNGIGIELFEFIEPKFEKRENNFEYWKCGTFHFCLVDPDIEETLKTIKANGGRARSQIYSLFPNKQYKMAYCEDPFGNTFEIYTHSYEQFFSNQIY